VFGVERKIAMYEFSPGERPSPAVQETGKRHSRVRSCFTWIAALLLFAGGLGVGFMAAQWFSPGSLASARNGGEGVDGLRNQFPIFWEAMELLYNDFYGEFPEPSESTYAAIRGVLNELDDPNTAFMSPEEANFFRENLQGSFEGIGARVDWDMTADTVVVVEPFENQPAWKAGIKRGDLITHVDGESILGTDLASAVEKIRGPKDTTVVLTVVRADSAAPFEVEVVRDRIEIPTIESRVVAGNLAYVRLNSFNENAGDLVRDAVEAALEEKPAGLIFDLRGNPGGLLRQAIDVAAVFLPQGQNVLIERFADGREEIYATNVEPVITDLPLVVLVNEGSASASEIVAGAIQDYQRGQLVGTVTYGKGSVQLPHTLSDDSILRVTVARWYTPDDRTIDGSGLQPDVLVELSEADREAQRDPQLEEAIRLLGGEAEALPVE